MKCLMFGLACDREQFDRYIKEQGNPYSVAHYLFETKMIEEMDKAIDVDHNYIYQSNNHSLRQALVRKKTGQITNKTATTYLNYFNLPIIKFLSIFFSTVCRIIRYNKKNRGDYFVMSTINYFPVAAATTLLSRILKYKNIGIFTDCSVGYAYDKSDSKSVKQKIRQLYKKIVHATESRYDAYVLFSEPMNELVNKKQKPYCVMEGFFNSDSLDLSHKEKDSKFKIVYAGTLLESIGVQNIIQAFAYIESPDVELKIYGGGDYKDKLQQIRPEDDRISFCGFIDHTELFEIEKKASLLVNVRDPNLAYTKYSFPSKTFEYLASGTPFLSTKLLCYPPEYDEHIIFINDNHPQTIAEAINRLICSDKDSLNQFGNAAKEFVLDHKNPTVQVQKVIDFIRKVECSL